MPEVYEIKDPRDGAVFELQLDHPPTPEEARTAVAKYRVTAAKASGQPTMGAAPPSRWQTFVQQMTAAMGPTPTGTDLPFSGASNPIGPNARAALTTPLARPTGIDAVDGLTSPLNLATAIFGAGAKAVSAMRPAVVAGVEAAQAANIGPELKSILLGHRGEKALKIAEKLRDALAESPAGESPVSTPPPSAARAGTPAPPAPTPRPVRPASAGSTPPAASQPRMATPANAAMDEIGDRMAGGADLPSRGNGAPSFDLNSLSPAEKMQALKWYEAGMPPAKIIQNIEASRTLTKGLGIPTPEQAAADVATRNAKGRWPE